MMDKRISEKTIAYIFVFLAAIYQASLIYLYDGTGDDGDSISHYFYGHLALKYKYNWINHWGKPVFTFLSTPFALLGFKGIQIFNSICAILAGFYAYKVAFKLNIPSSAFAIPIFVLMPEVMVTSFSGLTEVLFAFLLILSVYWILLDRLLLAFIMISFLPFCRPDGNLVILLCGLFALTRPKWWRYIPLLFVGHLALTSVGVIFFGESWTWLASKNPNTNNELVRVCGEWSSYLVFLLEIEGLPSYILMWVGIIVISYRLYRRKFKIGCEELIYILAIAIIGMHTVLFKYSLLRSIGLKRYVITCLPIIAILILRGIEGLTLLGQKIKISRFILPIVSFFVILIYVFSDAKYSAKVPEIYQLNSTQKLSIEVSQFVNKTYPSQRLIYHSYQYLNILFDVDPYDWEYHRTLTPEKIAKGLPVGSLIIWDDWYGSNNGLMPLGSLIKKPNLKLIKEFDKNDGKRDRKFVVFEVV